MNLVAKNPPVYDTPGTHGGSHWGFIDVTTSRVPTEGSIDHFSAFCNFSMAYFSSSSTPDDKAPGIEAAKLSQLSTSRWDMTVLKSTFQRKKVQREVMKSQIQDDRVAHDIKSFLAQAPARTPAHNEVFYTKHVSNTLLLESKEQQKMLHVQGGYRVRKTLDPAQKQI